ncbi:sorting nexin-3 [Tachysurus ichikawai]
MVDTVADTRRLYAKPQNLNDAYGPPSNFLEIDVSNPETIGVGRGRFTTYEIRLKGRTDGGMVGGTGGMRAAFYSYSIYSFPLPTVRHVGSHEPESKATVLD